MPHPIPMEQVIDVVVFYLIKRQIQGRPTTLRQVSKRVGLGAPIIKAEMERNHVQYILIPHGEREWVTSSTEVVIRSMPESLAVRNNFTLADVEGSYDKYFGKYKMEPLKKKNRPHRDVEEMALNMDPYGPYRISGETFRIMRSQLISFTTLIREARERGYSGRAVERATGGNRMRYALPGELWRPYVYRNHRYYLKEVLNYLHQSYRNYKRKSTAAVKKEARDTRIGEKDDQTERGATARPAKSNPVNRRDKRNRTAKAGVLN